MKPVRLPTLQMADWINLLALVWCLGYGLFVINGLPEQVAVHFNIKGQPDRFGSRGEAAFGLLIPALAMALIWLMNIVLLKTNAQVAAAKKTFTIIQMATAALMVLVQWWIASGFQRGDLGDGRLFIVALGVFFMIIGNVMPKTPPNRYAGIKFTWTFASDRAWYATHRVGGWLWTGLGALLALLGLVLPLASLMLVMVLLWLPLFFASMAWLWFYSKNQYLADPERRSL
jgi:uncharacterized membrane protein